ncbi:MAG TPA: hypothetical protein VIY10_20755, partial [Solirubrobacteraceae bacterium]
MVLVTALCALVFGPAQAAAAPAPRNALVQARGSVVAVAQQASSSSDRSLAAGAGRALARATEPALWIDAHDTVAPSYGTSVFVNSIAAVTDLQRLEGFSATGRSAAIRLVIGA